MPDVRSSLLALSALVWTGGVAVGVGALWRHTDTPGPAALPPARWPADGRLTLAPDRPTLVMFAHPQCPCTRASLGELARIAARCRGRAEIVVLFYRPAKAGAGWEQTNLFRRAASTPGVRVGTDVGGAAARRFGAQTSGTVALFDPSGRLLFGGGLTRARGHEGGGAGADAVTALLEGRRAQTARAPVFGCSLGGAASEKR